MIRSGDRVWPENNVDANAQSFMLFPSRNRYSYPTYRLTYWLY